MRSLALLLLLVALLAPTAAAGAPPLARVSAAGPIDLVAKPQTPVALPIVVENLGDVAVRIEFELAFVPTAGKWQVVPPHPIVLPPKSEPGAPANKTAILMVQTTFENGYVNESIAPSLLAKVRPVGEDGAPPEMHTLAWRVQSQGFYVPAPGAALMLIALAIAGSCWDRSRQRR